MSTVATLNGHTGSVFALEQLSNGDLASGSVDTTIKIWDSVSYALKATLSGHSNIVYALKLLSSGMMASGSADFSILIWDTSTYGLIKNISNSNVVYALELICTYI